MKEGVANGQQQPRSLRGREADLVRDVGPVVGEHYLFRCGDGGGGGGGGGDRGGGVGWGDVEGERGG